MIAFATLLVFMPANLRAEPLSGEIEIVNAKFGIGNRWVDVTDPLRELLADRDRTLYINSKSLQKGDPAPGKTKKLIVNYKYGAEEHVFQRWSKKTISHTMLVNHAMPSQAGEGKGESAVERPGESGEQLLTQEQMSSIVLIEGDQGVATGFIATVDQVDCVVTNLHVLGDNKNMVVRNLDGERIQLDAKGIRGAGEADIALIHLAAGEDNPPPLDLAENVTDTVKIGDRIVIVGNRLGGGVATQTTGTIRGVGPTRIEVNAEFKPGNSGSPIYHIESKKIIGVASYIQTVPAGKSSKGKNAGAEVRWFGYRVDTVNKWEAIDWATWRKQVQLLKAYREKSMAILGFIKGDRGAASKEPYLERLIDDYNRGAQLRTKAEHAKQRISDVLHFARKDSEDLKEAKFYSYFLKCPYWATNVGEQTEFRMDLIEAIGEIK